MSGFKVPGSLVVTLENLAAVPGYDPQGNVVNGAMIQTINAQQFTTARPTAYLTQAYTYYIKFTHDFNHHITHIAGPISVGFQPQNQLDDSWGIGHQIDINNTQDGEYKNLEYSLPTCSNISVPAGEISAKKENNDDALGTFAVTMNVSVNDQGLMTASISISGGDVTATFDENLLNAQIVKWMVGDNRDPTTFEHEVHQRADDSLSDVLTASQLDNDIVIQNLKTLLENEYNNVNMVASWRVLLEEIPQATDSILANYARATKMLLHGQRIFNDGDEIVVGTPAKYRVALTDYLDREVELISEADIYAVIVQGDHSS